ncbi:hypothetical protein B0H13DRAFT_1850196 [Mycena leptocephala]|nr:hypothetical protein B0H13DRAFT_1850196 [Mycena leptocephala]
MLISEFSCFCCATALIFPGVQNGGGAHPRQDIRGDHCVAGAATVNASPNSANSSVGYFPSDTTHAVGANPTVGSPSGNPSSITAIIFCLKIATVELRTIMSEVDDESHPLLLAWDDDTLPFELVPRAM